MDTKKAGRLGGQTKKLNFNLDRLKLLTELSKLVDKKLLNYIQMSKTRWTNEMLKQLIKEYKNNG